MIKREALYVSNNDEWETPDHIYDALDAEFHFTLDPCATDKNHKCEQYFTQSENGLLQNWGGAIECFAIRHTARLALGWKKRIEKASKTRPLWSYCFRPGQIPNTSMISSITGQKSDL